mmetsp:Transcript_51485/g.111689  ORF Transcript_51485/g.111689 Transcript_51485/m.111689 type:complete len:99 (+) Transcript_51485:263-559(+)
MLGQWVLAPAPCQPSEPAGVREPPVDLWISGVLAPTAGEVPARNAEVNGLPTRHKAVTMTRPRTTLPEGELAWPNWRRRPMAAPTLTGPEMSVLDKAA